MSQPETQTVPHQGHGEGLRQEPLMNPLSPDAQLCGPHSKHSQTHRPRYTPKHCKDSVTCQDQSYLNRINTHTHTHKELSLKARLVMLKS